MKNISNKELAEELHKPIIRKFKKRKVRSPFVSIICDTNLADMQLVSNFNKQIYFLLYFIDIYSKYVWVVSLKDKKGNTVTNAFQTILRESNCKLNKIWVNKGRKFYNTSLKL